MYFLLQFTATKKFLIKASAIFLYKIYFGVRFISFSCVIRFVSFSFSIQIDGCKLKLT